MEARAWQTGPLQRFTCRWPGRPRREPHSVRLDLNREGRNELLRCRTRFQRGARFRTPFGRPESLVQTGPVK
jgi:hypothetical protein